ncbi:FGGY-family carbohydrate kinase [Hutsoniella sourekii]|uniref:FGGY-family carbohydrate kinase n=1 Tax=Hutsoniella sourekii TaxID=87650 RepID=UPI000489E05D|nr:FGGY-family carbohydrate kinase [Hutsoniella sourekii]
MKHIIAVDVGTMSMRAGIYDEKGDNLSSSTYEYSSIYLPEGHVEQDPNDWKKALEFVLSEVGIYAHNNNIDIDAISVTSQRASVIPIDKYGNTLYNAVTWQDKRSIPINDRILSEYSLQDLYHKTGLRSNPYFSMPKMMWFKEEAPLIYQKTYKLIGVQDYVIYLLTGEFKTDTSQAARTMLMNIKTFEWDEEMLNISGIERRLLPDLMPVGSIAGGLQDHVSDYSKLAEGIPIIMAGGDQQNAALALNVLSEGKAEANTGTGSFIIAHTDKPVFDDEARVLCSASAMPGKWIIEASIFNTGSIYRWFRNQFYGEDTSFLTLNDEAASSPVGSNGVMLIPHFEGSAAPFWNAYAKGLFFNLSLGTTRADMTRAILEGISLEIASNIALIENISGQIKEISVAGGLTKSDLFNQMQSDISYKNVVRYKDSEASSLGATMSAFVTLGVYSNYEEAFEGVIGHGDKKEYLPNAQAHLTYNHVQARKLELYDALNENQVYNKFMGQL